MCGPDAVAVLDDLLHITSAKGLLFFETKDLNFVVFILENLDLFPVVE